MDHIRIFDDLVELGDILVLQELQYHNLIRDVFSGFGALLVRLDCKMLISGDFRGFAHLAIGSLAKGFPEYIVFECCR